MSKRTVIVVAHDAGGAGVIAAYLKKNKRKYRIHAYVAGPARMIFKQARITFMPAPRSSVKLRAIMRNHAASSFALIAAPGWMTKTEGNAIDAAKHAGLKTVVYMDSWGGEHNRYRDHVPDEFWAGDEYQMRLVRKAYPRTPVRLVRNQYNEDIVRRFRSRARNITPTNVLFMSDVMSGGEKVLDRFLAALPDGVRVRIRFHPADRRSRYNDVIRKHRRIHVSKSSARDIVHDLARARSVVGAETAAMVAALLVGKRTICLGHSKGEAVLPHKGIIRVRHPRDAAMLVA